MKHGQFNLTGIPLQGEPIGRDLAEVC